MALLLLQRPSWVCTSSISRLTSVLLLRANPHSHDHQFPATLPEGRRHASVKAQGAYKLKPRKTHPKKLGAKRSAGQYVVQGNILYKQRGTTWWPGENCIMGRDHTIHANASGYVHFYRDPKVHPKRQYIGVTFKREDRLPYPKDIPHKRRLNRSVHPLTEPKPEPEFGAVGPSGIPERILQRIGKRPDQVRVLKLQDDYRYAEENYGLGKALPSLRVKTKSYRSRRLHFRMRRIKQERRHMRLRKEKIIRMFRARDRAKKAAIMEKIVPADPLNPGPKQLARRQERAEKREYKKGLADKKAAEKLKTAQKIVSGAAQVELKRRA